jgi:hypothetical protein
MAIPADGGILTGQRLLKGKRSIGEKSGGILKTDAAKFGEESKKEGRQGNCPRLSKKTLSEKRPRRFDVDQSASIF